MRNSSKLKVKALKGKRPHGKPSHKLEGNTKTDLRKIEEKMKQA